MRFARRIPSCAMQIAIVLILLGVGLLAWMIGRAVSRPLSAMTGAMRKLADGRFRRRAARARPQGRDRRHGRRGRDVQAQGGREGRSATREEARGGHTGGRRRPQGGNAPARRQLRADRRRHRQTVSRPPRRSSRRRPRPDPIPPRSTQQLSGMVAAASEQASSNVQSVASATEEMTASVNEIGRQVQESAQDRRRGGAAGAADGCAHQRAVAGRPAASATW